MRARASDIEPAQRRRVDGARHRLAALDQRDVHRELVAALDEFPRAIEWIDQDEALGILARRGRTAFFGDDGYAGEILGKCVANDLVGGEVGGGDR